jgi:hypothetical protein
MSTIPPDMHVDADWQSVLDDQCRRGRSAAGWDDDNPIVLRALMKLYPNREQPEATTEVVGGGNTLIGKVRWIIENRSPITANQIKKVLGSKPDVEVRISQAIQVLRRRKIIQRTAKGNTRNAVWEPAFAALLFLFLIIARPAAAQVKGATLLATPSTPTTTATPTVSTTPTAPTLTAVVVPPTYSVTLAWDRTTDATATGSKIYWGITSRGYTNSVDAGTNLSLTLTNLPSATYYFGATAYRANGDESNFSNEAVQFLPIPYTNYVTPFVESSGSLNGPWTNYWSATLTNPPGASQFFRFGIRSTNNSVVRLSTGQLTVTNSP